MQKHVVYFIQAGPLGPIKIGFTNNIGNRLVALQLATFHELFVRSMLPGDKTLEAELKKKFSHLNLRGEWFKPDPEILEFLANQKQSISITEYEIKKFKYSLPPEYDPTAEGPYVCRHCCMAHDPQFKPLLAILAKGLRGEAARPRECLHCSRVMKIARHGLCPACSEYLRRNGKDRPLVKAPKPCISCGNLMHKITGGKGRCWTCYVYFRRNGTDRPEHLKAKTTLTAKPLP